MRKEYLAIFITICLNLVYVEIMFSQVSNWVVTPKIGVSYNSVYNPSIWGFKISPLLIGVESSKYTSERIGFSGELLYSRQGPHSRKVNSIRSQDYIFDFISFSPQFIYVASKRHKVETVLGPYAGYLFHAKNKFYPNKVFSPYDTCNKNLDIGLSLSLRKVVSLNKFSFVIETRSRLGLTQVSQTKQISLQLLFGARF